MNTADLGAITKPDLPADQDTALCDARFAAYDDGVPRGGACRSDIGILEHAAIVD